MSLLKDDREKYVVGGIASAISKALSKKLPKSKLKKDLSQPTDKDFENVTREEVLEYIEKIPLEERLELYADPYPTLKGKYEILDIDKIDFNEDVINFNKLPDNYKSGNNSLLRAYLVKNDIPEKYMGDFDAAGEFRNVPFFKELENGKIQITIPPSKSMGKKKTKTFTNPSKKQIENFFEQRENKNMGGILQDDNERYGMKEGGPGIEALREEAPDVVKRMGYKNGGKKISEMSDEEYERQEAKEMAEYEKQEAEEMRIFIKENKKPNETEDEFFERIAKENEEARKKRLEKAEGGSMMEQPMMEEPMMDEPEEDMLPDDEMEDEYLDFILDEALDSEEEDYLMSQLQDNDQLSMIFDKVIDVAQEFAGSGPVEGPGSGVSDSIPARLSDGEFVFTAKAVEEIGADNLMAMMKDAEMKADDRQGLAEGGEPEEETVEMEVEKPASKQDIRVVKTTVDNGGKGLLDEDEISKSIKSKMMLDNRTGRHVQS